MPDPTRPSTRGPATTGPGTTTDETYDAGTLKPTHPSGGDRPIDVKQGARTLGVSVGQPHALDGRTEVQVTDDGDVRIAAQRGDHRSSFATRLPAGQARALLDALSRLQAGGGAHRPLPDEPQYAFRLQEPGREPRAWSAWRRQLEEGDAEAARLLRGLGDAVAKASNGEALL